MTGPELKARRKELGLKLQDVAHALGIKHIQQVSEWERGKVRPGSKHLANLAFMNAKHGALHTDTQRGTAATRGGTNHDTTNHRNQTHRRTLY